MILTEAVEIHDTLNPKIWDDGSLIPEVHDAILEVVDAFMNDLEIEVSPVDILLLGSNASYNYTDKSDLDIHIVVNYDMIDGSDAVVQAMYNSARSLFNKNYDITIKGINAEIYVEDINTNTMSNGIYSVLNNRWIKYPSEIKVPDVDLEPELTDVTHKALDALASNDLDTIESCINDLYLMRKYSLATDGEYGKDNLIFKEIRNAGILDDLKLARLQLLSKELSLESLCRKESNNGNL